MKLIRKHKYRYLNLKMAQNQVDLEHITVKRKYSLGQPTNGAKKLVTRFCGEGNT